jgi:hypothetical protein
MKAPKVSICVPNLNTRPFLPERFETIFNQTFQDWKLIVYDRTQSSCIPKDGALVRHSDLLWQG